MTAATRCRDLADELVDLASAADLHGDPHGATRLRRLAATVHAEVEHHQHLTAGYPPARTADLPAGATVGWLWRHCPHTRAARRAAGLEVASWF